MIYVMHLYLLPLAPPPPSIPYLPLPSVSVGTWRHELPDLVAHHVMPWVSKGRETVRNCLGHNHDHLFVNPRNGQPFDVKRFAEYLAEITKEVTSFGGIGSQKLRRIFAEGSPLVPSSYS